jgi:hypothetical protein
VHASSHVAVQKFGTRTKIEGGVQIVFPSSFTAEEWCDYHGIDVVGGIVTLFKAVTDAYKSGHGQLYKPGKKVAKVKDWEPTPACGNGLHFVARPWEGLAFLPEATRFVACPVRVDEIVVIDAGKVKAPRVVGAIFEVDQDGVGLEIEMAAS